MKYVLPLLLILVGCGSQKAQIEIGSEVRAFGGDKGNGAEIIDEVNRAAWFRGKLARHACVIIDPNFGIPEKVVFDAIHDAEKSWTSYLREKGIEADIGLMNTWSQGKDSWGCRMDPRITYYFGGDAPEVQEAKSKLPNHVAFAQRTHFDIKKGESEGFIWVAPQGSLERQGRPYPDWTLDYNLAGILRHELGHVYGVDHIAETIMDERVADFLLLSDRERHERLAGIDSYRDLFICLECYVDRTGSLGFDKGAGVHEATANFEFLVGKPAVGPVIARIEGEWTRSARLIIDDFAGSYSFDIEIGSLGAKGDQGGIFRTARIGDKGQTIVEAIPHGPRVLYGTLSTQAGAKIPVIVELNMTTQVELAARASGPSATIDGLVIKTFNQGLPRILFFAVAY
jgi:hypothetical protein